MRQEALAENVEKSGHIVEVCSKLTGVTARRKKRRVVQIEKLERTDILSNLRSEV